VSLEVDGRTARRNRNLDAVLDAVLELFTEDSLEPGAADVAARSGVSLRSVYRYFDDTEALVRAAIARNLEQVQPLFEIEDLGEGPLDGRIERIVDRRLTLYEHTAPMTRASLRRASGNDLIREQLDRSQRAMRIQVEQMFAPELARLAAPARREVVAALDVLLGFPTLEHLRRTRRLSGGDTRAVVLRSVTAVLGSGTA
jgi:AcrR family transcriptional regulator